MRHLARLSRPSSRPLTRATRAVAQAKRVHSSSHSRGNNRGKKPDARDGEAELLLERQATEGGQGRPQHQEGGGAAGGQHQLRPRPAPAGETGPACHKCAGRIHTGRWPPPAWSARRRATRAPVLPASQPLDTTAAKLSDSDRDDRDRQRACRCHPVRFLLQGLPSGVVSIEVSAGHYTPLRINQPRVFRRCDLRILLVLCLLLPCWLSARELVIGGLLEPP